MNKKILAFIVSAVIISFFGVNLVSAAANMDGCKITKMQRLPAGMDCTLTSQGNGTYCLYNTGDCGMCCLLNSVYNITDWVFVVLMAIASLMIIWGAVNFTTSQGDPDKTKSARMLILYAAVGIAVALFARAVPPAVQMIIGA